MFKVVCRSGTPETSARHAHARHFSARNALICMLGMFAFAYGSASAQANAAFVYLVGQDTIAVERFTIGGGLLLGEVLMRGQPRMTYVAQRSETVNSLDLTAYPPNSGADAQPMQRASLRLVNDSVVVEMGAGTARQTQRLLSRRNALLLLNTSIAQFQPAIEQMTGARRDSMTMPIFLASGGQTIDATFRRVSPDSIVLRLGPQESSIIVKGTQITRVRTPSQSLVVERVEGPAAARLSAGKPDYSAPAGAPYRAEQVTVPTPAGHTLAGTLTIPANTPGRVPAVITVTGSGPQDRDEHIPLVSGFRPFRQVADTLGRRGIAVLRYDDRGTGESTGNFAAATSADFADDVRAAITFLRARPDIDPDRIVVLGHSEGGLIAPMVAATDPRLAGIVLLAGPSKTGRTIIDFQLRYGIDHDSTIAPAKKDSAYAATRQAFDSGSARQPWMRFFLQYDPLPTVRQVRVPVLILQGATDRQVTADQAEALGAALRAAGNSKVLVRVYPDRNHLFLPDPDGSPAGYVRLPNGRIGPEVMGQIADWLVTTLK